MKTLGHVLTFLALAFVLSAGGCQAEGEKTDSTQVTYNREPLEKTEANTVYRYEDDAGSLHFVTGKHNIPPQYLSRATTVDGAKLKTHSSDAFAAEESEKDDPSQKVATAGEAEEEKRGMAKVWATISGLFSGAWGWIRSWLYPPEYKGPPDLMIYDFSGKSWRAWCDEIASAMSKQKRAVANEDRVIGSGRLSRTSGSERKVSYKDGRKTVSMDRKSVGPRHKGETMKVYNAGRAADEAIMDVGRKRSAAMHAGNPPEWVLSGSCSNHKYPTPKIWPNKHPLYTKQ